jgi:hypothetical protein
MGVADLLRTRGTLPPHRITVNIQGEQIPDVEAIAQAIERESWLIEAKTLGIEHARSAATWTTDGNSDKDERARVLGMMRAGDPMADNYLPRVPELSGEFADDLTPLSLCRRVLGTIEPEQVQLWEEGGENAHSTLMDELASAYEEGVSETFSAACEAQLIAFCEPAKSE